MNATTLEDNEYSHAELSQLIEHCINDQLTPLILALPMSVPDDEIKELLDHPQVNGIITGGTEQSGGAVGHFIAGQYDWAMPSGTAPTIACLGPRTLFSFTMINTARQHGVSGLVYTIPTGFHNQRVYRFLIARLIGNAWRAAKSLTHLAANRLWLGIKEAIPAIAALIHGRIIAPLFDRVIKPVGCYLNQRYGSRPLVLKLIAIISDGWQHFNRSRVAIGHSIVFSWRWIWTTIYRYRMTRLFNTIISADDKPLLPKEAFEPDRIIEVNTNLNAGGAERQIINTMFGLLERGYDEITVLCDKLEGKDNDFYLSRLENTPIEGVEIRKEWQHDDLLQLDPAMVERVETALATIYDDELRQDIYNLALEFLIRRPEVVHLWQDAMNIKGAIAAALVGVPRIVITLVNMAADRFPHFYFEWFWPGYKALIEHPNVIIINNSHAGIADYERWLKIDKGRITCLHNGLEEESIPPVSQAASDAYRKEFGIPLGVPVVGGINRFQPEKNPLLWVETMKRVTDQHPTVVFLLIGIGPLHDRMRELAASYGLAERFFTPGIVTNPAIPLSIFDLFLLTSKQEGIPNVVIEAQWSGVPVVSTDAGGTRDAVEIGKTGWIIESRDADEIAERVLFVLNNDEWRAEARKRSPAMAAKRFGMGRMIDETLQVFNLPMNRIDDSKRLIDE